MLYLVERRLENTFVYLKGGQYYTIIEVLDFDFEEKVYKLVGFQIEEIAQLKGGKENE